MTHTDGRHDFDFYIGKWQIHNRKLTMPLEPGADEWVEFEALSTAWPLLGGLGNVDTYLAPDFPGRGHFEGATIRLFDPETGLWRIWWASILQPGRLDVPLEGRFEGKHGVFECEETMNDQQVKVRFDWHHNEDDTVRWEQSFSFDDGQSWNLNWVMSSTRLAE